MKPKTIQQRRLALGWSTADLAARIGVSARTVENWEQGRPISEPARKLLNQILK